MLIRRHCNTTVTTCQPHKRPKSCQLSLYKYIQSQASTTLPKCQSMEIVRDYPSGYCNNLTTSVFCTTADIIGYHSFSAHDCLWPGYLSSITAYMSFSVLTGNCISTIKIILSSTVLMAYFVKLYNNRGSEFSSCTEYRIGKSLDANIAGYNRAPTALVGSHSGRPATLNKRLNPLTPANTAILCEILV